MSKAVQEVLDLMDDGFNLIQFIGYDDKEYPFYLRQPFGGTSNYKEKVPTRVAQTIIAMPRVKFTRGTNWKVWTLSEGSEQT